MAEPEDALSLEAARALTLDLEPGRFRMSMWRNVTMTIWTAQANQDAAERVLRVCRQLSRDLPNGRSQVMFICAGAPAPDQTTSELLTEIYDPHVSGIRCIAAVLEGTGFWASGIRSRMTNMRIAAGSAMVMRTQDTIDEVVAWLPQEHEARTGVKVTPEELWSVLSSVRSLGTRDP